MKYKVSVCIISYNQEAFIASAIEGALLQKTDFEYEILISDDCSTDKTPEIIAKYKSRFPSKINVIKNQKNVGFLNNFDRAIRACQGEIIAYCEGDDYWICEDKLQIQYDILTKYSDVSFVHGSWTDFEEINGTYHQRPYTKKIIFNEPFSFERLISYNPTHALRFSSICFRKSQILEILDSDYELYHDNKYKANDYSLKLALLMKGRDVFIDKPIVLYRRLKESVSITQDQEKRYSFVLGVLLGNIRNYKKYNIPQEFVNKALKHYVSSVYKYACVYGARSEIKELSCSLKNIGYKFSLFQYFLYYGMHFRFVYRVACILEKIFAVCRIIRNEF